ncbi:hypothetical protein IAT38_001109 [Cryptococcus sp. DSM 104549]
MAPPGTQQASLESFFKRKPPVSQPRDDSGVIDLTDGSPPPPAKKIRLESSQPPSQRPSQTTSSYFGKPKLAPTRPPPSSRASSSRTPFTPRTPVILQSYRLPNVPRSQLAQSGSAFDTYWLGVPDSYPDPDSQPSASQHERTAEQVARHEAWQERVTAMGGTFRRRRSLALDEAVAAEARKAAGLDDGEGEEGGGTPVDADKADEDGEGEEKKKAEGVGKKLAAKYAVKVDAKGAKGKGKKKEEVGPSGMTYTPLEKQFMEIKEANQDVLLLMEVGYKYKFHGEDAKTAAAELGIVAFPSRNFFTASIPTHRLHIHVKKLISLGYKVGVITQTETAALKKISDNRNAPFSRELTHLFTAATYVEEPSFTTGQDRSDDSALPGSAPPPTNALVAIVEIGMGGMALDERVRIGLVSVIPGTGEVVWDEFDDSQVRSELETRLTHLQPAELLLPAAGLSKATEKVLSHFAGGPRTSGKNTVRVERIENVPTYDAAFDQLTKFYKARGKGKVVDKPGDQSGSAIVIDDEDEPSGQDGTQLSGGAGEGTGDSVGLAAGLGTGLDPGEAVLALVDFPKQIVIVLAVAVHYMTRFGLENVFRNTSSFSKFLNRSHMLLSSNTLSNLEIYKNQTDGGLYGSLVWLLDHCKTRMGRRLLREWIGRPLLDVAALRARTDAIEEIMSNNSYHMEKLRSLLVNMPDLVKGLTRVQYGKTTPTELATLLVTLVRIASEFKPGQGNPFNSPLLNSIPNTLPSILETARGFLSAINIKEARNNNKAELFVDPDKYPDIQDIKDCISICEHELEEHLKEVRKVVKKPSLKYITVSGIEYLIEVPVRDAKLIPPKWVKISATKTVNRYHTPDILQMTKEREQHKEKLARAADQAFLDFQSDISECHELLVVSKQIAVIDCLISLAQVAGASGYCKPQFVVEPVLAIREGRHPMVEMLKEDAYVPFDIDFSKKDGTAKVITGPNMAGKSSCVRAAALIVCLAQIGSFVPATSVTLGVHDAVQTRMGASDEIGRGKSTFMVELSETSDILRTVTPRTLVILDELGRGTSTYDGVAIAYATLSHVADIGCNTLFVTHYPMVAEELAREKPGQISNWHMSFDEQKQPDGHAEITFLYQLSPGLAEASFGVWCARLAGLPNAILQTAQLRSDSLKVETEKRQKNALVRRTERLFKDVWGGAEEAPGDVLKNLRILYKGLELASSRV